MYDRNRKDTPSIKHGPNTSTHRPQCHVSERSLYSIAIYYMSNNADARGSRRNESTPTRAAESEFPPEPTITIGSSCRSVPTAPAGAATPTRLVAQQPSLTKPIHPATILFGVPMQSVQWVPAFWHDRAMRYRILTYMGGAKGCGGPPRRWHRPFTIAL